MAALTSFARDYHLRAATIGIRSQTSLGLPAAAHALFGHRRAIGTVIPGALLAFGGGPAFLSAGIPIDRAAVAAEAGLEPRVALNATLGIA